MVYLHHEFYMISNLLLLCTLYIIYIKNPINRKLLFQNNPTHCYILSITRLSKIYNRNDAEIYVLM